MKDYTKTYSLFCKNLTQIRLSTYQLSFDAQNNSELMGAYLWGVQASSALYPLLHFVEILVRNSIDNAIRKKHGDYWWNSIDYDKQNDSCKSFKKNIEDAEKKLQTIWRKTHNNKNYPNFTHDQIIAATNFSTWTYIFTNGFLKVNNKKSKHIWPNILGQAIPRYNTLNNKPRLALKAIHDELHAIRLYRNRVFHHEPIWTKGRTNTLNSVRSIQTIREKITKIENFIKLLGDDLYQEFISTNVFDNARKVCSLECLHMYQNKSSSRQLTRRQKRIIRKTLPKNKQEIRCIKYDGSFLGISHIF